MDYFPAFFKYRKSLSALSDEQVGRVFRAALEYAEEGTVPRLGVAEKMAFDFIASDIDTARTKYDAICEKRREAISKRWGEAEEGADTSEYNSIQTIQMNTSDTKQTNKQTNKTNKQPPTGESTRARARVEARSQSGRMTVGGPDASAEATHRDEPVPPTFDEICAYCDEAKLTHINRKKFFENYATTGWRRNGEPIRDWRACARKWDTEDSEKARAGQGTESQVQSSSFESSSFLDAALMRSYGEEFGFEGG